jgi:hypothetical protein
MKRWKYRSNRTKAERYLFTLFKPALLRFHLGQQHALFIIRRCRDRVIASGPSLPRADRLLTGSTIRQFTSAEIRLTIAMSCQFFHRGFRTCVFEHCCARPLCSRMGLILFAKDDHGLAFVDQLIARACYRLIP